MKLHEMRRILSFARVRPRTPLHLGLGLVSLLVTVLPAARAVNAATTPLPDQPAAARALSMAFAGVVRAVRPSVVRLEVVYQPHAPEALSAPDPVGTLAEPAPPSTPRSPRRRIGSGVIVDDRGFLITNRHVVLGATAIAVILHDGRKLSADQVGDDRRTDLALVRLREPPADLMQVRLGDSSAVQVGEWVLALGCPLGMHLMVTVGIVSAKGLVGRRMGMGDGQVGEYLQTDAKLNTGSSGGPLINLDGEVVGINTLMRSGRGGGYGFAVPAGEVKRVAAALLAGHSVPLPYLGVEIHLTEAANRSAGTPQAAATRQSTAPETAAASGEATGPSVRSGRPSPTAPTSFRPTGVRVFSVTPGSPAALAGLRPGDVIVGLEGNEIADTDEFQAVVNSRDIGARVRIDYLRQGRRATIQATLTAPPARSPLPSRLPATDRGSLAL
jgi:S1-C subfamily serine protease